LQKSINAGPTDLSCWICRISYLILSSQKLIKPNADACILSEFPPTISHQNL
jgi:hypothetical protein